MSGAASDPKNWRELRARLMALGGRRARTNGSHEIWRFGDGHSFVIVRNHLSDAVPVGILVKFRRQVARYRAFQNEEPPLLARVRGQGGLVLAEQRRKHVEEW